MMESRGLASACDKAGHAEHQIRLLVVLELRQNSWHMTYAVAELKVV